MTAIDAGEIYFSAVLISIEEPHIVDILTGGRALKAFTIDISCAVYDPSEKDFEPICSPF